MVIGTEVHEDDSGLLRQHAAKTKELPPPRATGGKPLIDALRVCPKTSGKIAKFSEHEAD
jgi:hypothetical protein